MSRGPIPDLPADRPKVPQVAAMIRAIHESPGGAAGCCLHIFTDDFNLGRGNAEFCAEWARERGHALCLETATALASMTRSQQRRAVRTWRGA